MTESGFRVKHEIKTAPVPGRFRVVSLGRGEAWAPLGAAGRREGALPAAGQRGDGEREDASPAGKSPAAGRGADIRWADRGPADAFREEAAGGCPAVRLRSPKHLSAADCFLSLRRYTRCGRDRLGGARERPAYLQGLADGCRDPVRAHAPTVLRSRRLA